MKRSSRPIFVIVLVGITAAVSGCLIKPVEVKTPEVKKYEFKTTPWKIELPELDFSGFNLACSLEESKQNVSPEARRYQRFVQGEVQMQKGISVDCDGKETQHNAPLPVTDLDAELILPAPSNLKEEVQFVRVDNQRTCSQQSTAAIDDEKLKTRVPGVIRVGKSGVLHLSLSDSIIHSLTELNVDKGENAVSIEYFGKCLKLKEGAKPDDDYSEACAEPTTIAKREMLLHVKIEYKEIDGFKRVNICKDEKKKTQKP
jgi:hypothetical protein